MYQQIPPPLVRHPLPLGKQIRTVKTPPGTKRKTWDGSKTRRPDTCAWGTHSGSWRGVPSQQLWWCCHTRRRCQCQLPIKAQQDLLFCSLLPTSLGNCLHSEIGETKSHIVFHCYASFVGMRSYYRLSPMEEKAWQQALSAFGLIDTAATEWRLNHCYLTFYRDILLSVRDCFCCRRSIWKHCQGN